MAMMTAAADGEVKALRSEVAALGLRVEELERENQMLAKIVSSCRCSSTEDNILSSLVASASLDGNTQGVQQNGNIHESRTSDEVVSFAFDHMATYAENQEKCDENAEPDVLHAVSFPKGVDEDNIVSSLVASASLDGNTQGAQQNGNIHESRTSDEVVSFAFDHMATSTENQEKCDENAEPDVLHADSNQFTKVNSTDTPGCKVETIINCPKRLIALKIMYFGQRFYGFASEAHMEPTVEFEIFKALERAKLLVGNKKESFYSRCGRTDKGVSATGQVISLYLRSHIKGTGGDVLQERSEIDYVKVLNKVLPRDIRVIGWCPVMPDFHARFTCLGREYRYLFWKGNLDILAMQKAASKFIGEHDFRNFCKMDAANVTNYRRHIRDFSISAYDQRSNDDELWAITIKGSAFLWHQVRCMVAVLFLIGQGLEPPDIIDSLLDIAKTPRKPQYNMAPELPLILRSCQFDKVSFISSSDASQTLIEHLKNEYCHYMVQAAIFHEALSCLSFPESYSFELHQKKKNHIPLMSRQTEPSYEERLAKFKTKLADSL